MTIYETMSEPRGGLPVDNLVCADSLCRALLSTVSGTVGGWVARTPLLGRRGQLPPGRRHFELARDAYAEAVPHDQVGSIDADAIAEWIVGHYREDQYPAVLLGSPHGSAAHLAVALGAAWLPTSVPLTVSWPGGSVGDWPGALEWGADLARLITARNPGITVRQVHDPLRGGPLCGATVRFHLRWATLPAAYERFLRTRLAPDGSTLLTRDLRTWPVTAVSARHSFQVGSPVGGSEPEDYALANPEFRRVLETLGAASWSHIDPETPQRYAERSGEPSLGVDLARLGESSHKLLYARPGTLSACVADLLRQWRSDAGDRCVIECGRLLDPWLARAGGLVPYWAESAARSTVEGAEMWLAGSDRFDGVAVLPEPPGHTGTHVATLAQWRALASFGRRREPIDRFAAGRYPTLPVATGHATRMLAGAPLRPLPPVMPMAYAIDRLRQSGSSLGMLFT
ncbi:hypothetical protein M1L60_02510 [Actinoplanes sp. TRM 88003]|uniref:Uncharacterized protein n=1 Tax=Paractinoplanes aksuensis TaxID=2939490 RepID=A0ABT1DF82_9ACTN|nr:hypothetical protein [Actinoplanes aksuensis]MCO8269460.1 hypothetical protein [Actinoplanes aksuensis]